ncbi:MAG: hypothetical protein ACJ8EB_13285, partial [Allosphingosinicella sp.]
QRTEGRTQGCGPWAFTTRRKIVQLRLIRSQADQKGFFGGHKGVSFALRYKLEVSSEEQALVDRYKVADFVVHTVIYGKSSQGEPYTWDIHVKDLINGNSVALRDFSEVVKSEDAVTQGAANLKGLLERMRHFGGEEVVEI